MLRISLQAPAIVAKHLAQRVGKVFREKILNAFADRLGAAQIKNLFERGIQARHAALKIHRQQSNVDRLNDRLVKLLEKFQLAGALLLLLIKQTVFNRDRDITGDSQQNLNVFRRKQRAIGRTPQSNDRHHPAAHNAGHVIVKRAPHKAGRFRNQIQIIGAHYSGFRRTDADHLAKVRRHDHLRRKSRGAGHAITRRRVFVFDENRNATNVHHLLQAADERIKQRIERRGGGKRAAEIKQAVAHVVALAIEQPVDLFLQKALYRRGDHHDSGHRDDGDHHAQRNFAGSETLIAAERVESRQVNHRANHQGNRQRRQHVNKDAAHDQLDVHQPIANN